MGIEGILKQGFATTQLDNLINWKLLDQAL